jgi:uracil-DNA glycosylase
MVNILILGEAWGAEEEAVRRPFVGASGRLLHSILHQVGIDKHECYLTNVFNLRPKPTNDVLNLCGPKAEALPGYPPLGPAKYIRWGLKPELDRLYSEIEAVAPNLIIALGNTAIVALTKAKYPISKNRGNLFESFLTRPDGSPYKVIATYHPAAVLREWTLRPIVAADLAKARRHAASPEFTRPSRQIWIRPTLDDLYAFESRYMIPPSRPCAVDIETACNSITEIGFGYPEAALVVPFYSRGKPDGNYWTTPAQEHMAWGWVRRALATLRHPVFQNGLYDLNYLWRTIGIEVKHAGEDTMLLHHALQPEMKKGLGFLGSVYTDEPSWKLMRRETLKKEE